MHLINDIIVRISKTSSRIFGHAAPKRHRLPRRTDESTLFPTDTSYGNDGSSSHQLDGSPLGEVRWAQTMWQYGNGNRPK